MANYIKTLRTIQIVMLMGTVMLLAVFYFTKDLDPVMPDADMNKLFMLMSPLLGIMLISASFIVFKLKIKQAKKESDKDAKLMAYRVIFIVRIALINASAIFSAIAFKLTSNNVFLMFSVIALAFYYSIFPTSEKIISDLESPELFDNI